MKTLITFTPYHEIAIWRERREHGLAGLTRYTRYSPSSQKRINAVIENWKGKRKGRVSPGYVQWMLQEKTLP